MTLKVKIQPQIIQTVASSLDFLVLFICGIMLVVISKFESISFLIFGICIIIFGLIQFISHSKTFYLYENELIVKYPLSFNLKKDIIIKLNKIEQINFKRGRGPYIVINLKNSERIFRINMSEKDIDIFVSQLNKLGIKTNRNNI